MNDDPHSLIGPYALHALPDEERAAFRAHLAECETCREELAEFEATAARLGTAAAERPPPELRARVRAEISRVRQVPPLLRPEQRQRPGRRRFLLAAAAAVVAAAGGVAVVQTVRERRSADEQRRLAEILAAPDARTLHTDVTGGGRVTLILSAESNAAAAILDRLPALASDRTYQMWLMHGARPSPAGLVDVGAGERRTGWLSGQVADATGFGLTVEPEGGSRAPTTDPIALLELR